MANHFKDSVMEAFFKTALNEVDEITSVTHKDALLDDETVYQFVKVDDNGPIVQVHVQEGVMFVFNMRYCSLLQAASIVDFYRIGTNMA